MSATNNHTIDPNDLELNSSSSVSIDQHQVRNCGGDLNKWKLKDETIYRLVDHAVGSIASGCGYHMAHQSSLDILTDVCCDYLKKIATLLRTAQDTEEWRDPESDFVDSIERVFHQINIPSVANLHQFVSKMEAIKKHNMKQVSSAAEQDLKSCASPYAGAVSGGK